MTTDHPRDDGSPGTADPPKAWATARDSLLLGAGTFTAVPVPPPHRVDRTVGAGALLTAPLWGALVGALGGLVAVGLYSAVQRSTDQPALAALLGGLGFVAATAMGTRGLHLDGFADWADGMASMKRGDAAVSIMRDPHLGALGVIALVLLLAFQIVTAALVVAQRDSVAALVTLVAVATLSRAPLAFLARRGTPAAGAGLGSSVVGGPPRQAAVLTGVAVSALAMSATVAAGWSNLGAGLSLVAVWLSALWVRHAALRRFHVMTGDSLGAGVELSTAVALLALVLTG